MSDPISPLGSPGRVPSVAVAGSRTYDSESKVSANLDTGTAPAPAAAQGLAETQTFSDASAKAASTKVDSKSLEEAAKVLKDHLAGIATDLSFKVDEATGITTFKVINPITKEVIREYPPKEVLEMAKRLKESAKPKNTGILVDEKH